MADLKDMVPVYIERTKDDVCALPEIPMAPLACCANCNYARSYKDQLECHRFAPRPVTGSKVPAAAWPLVLATEWCGDYKLKGS